MSPNQSNIQQAQQYVQDLQKHIGSPTRLQDATIVVGTRRDPSCPLVVVALTNESNRLPLDDILIQMRVQTQELIISTQRNPEHKDDLKGWRHHTRRLTVARASKALTLTTMATAGFNILLNASGAPETLATTLESIPIFAGISMLITACEYCAQADKEKKKANELISRSATFDTRTVPNADCFTGDAEQGVYAGIVAAETCRLTAEASVFHPW